MSGLAVLSKILPSIFRVVDKVVADKDAANAIRAELTLAMIAQDSEAMRAASDVVMAEAGGESWLQRNWRPIAMLNFLGLLNLYWFGQAPDYLVERPELVERLFGLLSIGIGGYIVGRSGEKMVKGVVGALRG